ncbi:transmembrane and coiled-coil domain-containing protein 4 [Lepisosteus oculatus]|uniref:transmembrane and coiled-coil domain-containing protein 4 n=1 Tax=Lepisosteus oculatus TaxID=7918 RepID=UPI003722F0C0
MEAEEPDSTEAKALQDSSLGGVGGVSPAEGLVPPSSEAVIGRLLGEPGRFAYAALCAVSLAQLFPGSEHRLFRQQYVQALVSWLGLCDTVLPVMEAFLGGLGLEGTDTFLSVLQKEPRLGHGAQPVIQDLVSFSVRDGFYDARARVLIRHVSCLLRVSPRELEDFEETLGERLRRGGEETEEEESRRRRKERGRKLKRYLLIGLATVGGGTVIGLTGGLAAPLVAAGAGAVIGAGGAAALGSVAGIAIMASLFGAAGAGLTGYKMNKRVGAIEEFEFRPLSTGKHLHLTIAVTGWLCRGKYSSFQAPWASLRQSREQYCLCWESRYLLELGSALDSLLDGLVSMVAQEALKYTVLSGILTALTWPASLLAVASVIDNPWGVCLSRSAEVGKQLAQVLRSRHQGRRPVSLIGFSLGARVIYFCLQELANDTDCEGVIEDVVLLGAPVDGSARQWKALSRVVSGRIINGYCRGDWLLSFVYRSSSAQLSVAGLQPINLDDRRMMNVDLSSVVKGHLDYMRQIETILVAVGVPTREGACLGDVLSMPQESVATEREPKPEPESDQSALGGGANEGGTEPGDEAGGVVCGAGVESVCRLGGGGGPGQEEPSVSEAERKEEDGVTTTTSPQTEGNGGRRGGLEHAGQY